ncbi:MAG TPA: polynucleotide adenylyltransferase PcnB [Planctomycetota bacterium]|nr:polynucleotide adenylyltransferase PcnB [Planctomycetota bacterium]
MTPREMSRDEPGGRSLEPTFSSGLRVVPAQDIEPASLDQNALRVVSRLQRHGYQAYLVGGCVRDLLLGRRPKDFDVATAAHPRQAKRLFANGRIIGRRFRLVHVAYGTHIVETATFRRAPSEEKVDGEDLLIVEDNEFGTAAEDAVRRDFTINALFLDPARHEILDYVDGLADLERGCLRTIGDPFVRLAEDPVRILRAVKFATRLGFRIDEATWNAMCELSEELSRSAKPRVLEEILRLMRSGTALGAFRMLRACGALNVILPELDRYLGRRDDPDPSAHDRADQFWRLLEALDAFVHSGHVPTTPVCIAVLFLRVIEFEADPATRTLAGAAPEDIFIVTGEVLEPFSLSARLPRRDCASARRLISLQRRFTQVASKRFRPATFLRSEDFPEALDLFRLRSMAWGQGWDVYEAWVQRSRNANDSQDAPPAFEAEEELPRKRRRRRRGRRAPAGTRPEADSEPEP